VRELPEHRLRGVRVLPEGGPATASRAIGIPSPWSGDEHDPIPWIYRARQFIDGGRTERCDWCGETRLSTRGLLPRIMDPGA
jgi:hypothetical protein